MNISLNFVQFDIKTNDPLENIKKIEKLSTNTQQTDSDQDYPKIILLPELFTTGYGNFSEIREFSINFNKMDDLASEQVKSLRELAAYHKATIIGSIPELKSNKLFNSCLKITSESVDVIYRKMHLIGPMDEPKFFTSGETISVDDSNSINIGMQICYDLRFPEAARYLCSQGAKLLVYTANWPSVRSEHWNHLIIARAIENQCFVIGANRIGSDKWGEYCGNSQIISPVGKILASVEREEIYSGITVDFRTEIENARAKFNVHKDRKINFKI
ncbi:MAG: nitrilase-related carbon-nitrogen hydrolase [Candidatus Hodarchaeales archaeon]